MQTYSLFTLYTWTFLVGTGSHKQTTDDGWDLNSYFCMSGTLTLICTIFLDLAPPMLCLMSFPHSVPAEAHCILSEQGRMTSTRDPLGKGVQGLWTLGNERRILSQVQGLL